jgi:hypothetical protein
MRQTQKELFSGADFALALCRCGSSRDPRPAARVSQPGWKQRVYHVGLLLIAITLVALPVSGTGPSEWSALTKLRTTFVPFDASVGTPAPASNPTSIATLSGTRLTLGPASASHVEVPDRSSFPIAEVFSQKRSSFRESTAGRSPPL